MSGRRDSRLHRQSRQLHHRDSSSSNSSQSTTSLSYYGQDGPQIKVNVITAQDVFRDTTIALSHRVSSIYSDDTRSARSVSSERPSLTPSFIPTEEELPEEVDFFSDDGESFRDSRSSYYSDSSSDDEFNENATGRMSVMSIHDTTREIKSAGAKQRLAQQVKLKTGFFKRFAQPILDPHRGSNVSEALSESLREEDEDQVHALSTDDYRPSSASVTFTHPTQQEQQRMRRKGSVIGALPKKKRQDGYTVAGTATLSKWNRWIQNQYNTNTKVALGRVLEATKTLDKKLDQFQQPFKEKEDVTSAAISLEEVIGNPRMVRYYASWLEREGAKLFFLCSLDEYRKLWRSLVLNTKEESEALEIKSPEEITEENHEVMKNFAEAIADQYLYNDTPQFLGMSFITSNDAVDGFLNDAEISGLVALHIFDALYDQVKRVLMCTFPEFRNSELYQDLYDNVQREVYPLENILTNLRFVNFYWIFLFQHNYHREMALWLEVEYDYKSLHQSVESLTKRLGATHVTTLKKKDALVTMIKYLIAKFFPGDPTLKHLHRNVTSAYSWLTREQDGVVRDINEVHVDLYPRFLKSKAYSEFASYRQVKAQKGASQGGSKCPTVTAEQKLDVKHDLRRLSFILSHYGLRLHQWDEDEGTLSKKSHTLEKFIGLSGVSPVHYVISFDTTSRATVGKEGVNDVRLRVTHQTLPTGQSASDSHEQFPGIEGFLVPWCLEADKCYLTSVTCPPPQAFNTFITSGAIELYAAVLIVYTPGPVLTRAELAVQKVKSTCRWVPSGICVLSKYPLLNVLRHRLSAHFETYVAAPADLTSDMMTQLTLPYTDRLGTSTSHVASLSDDDYQFPKMDFSLQLLFETLDIATVITVFAALLLECRVLFISKYYSVLSRLAESFRVLLHPLKWPHVYLPILPGLMIDVMQCPTPFLIGCNKEVLTPEILQELGTEVMVVDLDKSQIIQGEVPVELPQKLLNSLFDAIHGCLKSNVMKADHVFFDSFPTKDYEQFPEAQIRLAFYESIMEIIGNFGYYRYVWKDELTKDTVFLFDEASYLASSCSSSREFRTAFIATHFFTEFITLYNGFEEDKEDGL